MIKITFFISIFLTVYSYAVYPVILLLVSRIFRKDVPVVRDANSSVTLIISAFNEEDVIARKIENSLKLDYPEGLLEIMVISDHSTDNTENIVKGYQGRGVVLLSSSERRGKTAGLNDGVRSARGKIVVFSDADAMYPVDTIKKIVFLLNNKSVGLVTGSTKYIKEGDEGMAETSSIYTRLEHRTKSLESMLGSCVGADGAIFGMHKHLYQPLNNDDINDLVIPLKVVRQGYRVILGDNIVCTEAASSDARSEFSRQIRITNRTLRALFRNSDLLNFVKYPLFSFEIISHKLIRFCIPFFLLFMIPLNLMLVTEGNIYKLLMAGQFVFYFLALLGFFYENKTGKDLSFSFVYHFVMVQGSILLGWIGYLSGKNQVTWNIRR